MAREGEAAIGFSWKTTLNGLLPSPGPLTSIAELGDRFGAATVGGVSLRGVGFGTVEGTFASDLESSVLSLDFSSEGVASSILLAREELSESMDGLEGREAGSAARFGSVGDVASGIVFWASWGCFSSGPRPTVSPTATITASKITDANATSCNPDSSRTKEREGESLIWSADEMRSADDSILAVRSRGPNSANGV